MLGNKFGCGKTVKIFGGCKSMAFLVDSGGDVGVELNVIG